MLTVILSLFVCAVAPPSGEELLRSMVDGRRSFATADISWKQSATSNGREGFYHNRYDGSNWTFSLETDPDGVRPGNVIGNPYSCSAAHNLVTKEGLWTSTDNGGPIQWRGGPSESLWGQPVVDVLTAGLMPEPCHAPLDVAIWRELKDNDSLVTDEGGGIFSVTAKTRSNSSITWWLDSGKNYQPIRVVRRDANNALMGEATIQLALFEGRIWFPTRVESRLYFQRGGGSPNTIVTELTDVQFDRPAHPKLLTPLNIGIEPGTQILDNGTGQLTLWDGRERITFEELRNRGRRGQLEKGFWDNSLRRRAQMRSHSGEGRYPQWYSDPVYGISKPSDIDEWEKYVRRFCLIRKCDDRQKASAKGILEDCRKVAVPMLARIKTEQAKEKDAVKRDAMLAPIADIFTKNLVPRLGALLATAQSQPATPPTKPTPVAGR